MPRGLEGDNGGEDGWNAALQAASRLTEPLPRPLDPRFRLERNAPFLTATWADAVDHMAAHLTEIIDAHGPQSIAFLGCDQLDTEAVYLAVKLFKGSIGSNNTASCSRYAASWNAAAAGFRSSLGADGSPASLSDLDHADCAIVWGADLAIDHPELVERVIARKRTSPNFELIVIGSDQSPLLKEAALWVPISQSGETALFNAVARLLIEHDALDHRFIARHTTGFDSFFHLVIDEDLADLVSAAGVPVAIIRELTQRIATSRAWMSIHVAGRESTGNESAQHNSVINLHLLTGQVGKPGAGPLPLSSQFNAFGAREAGLLSDQLPGFRFVDDRSHRDQVESYWNRPSGTISRETGLSPGEMIEAIERGRIKAVWIAASGSGRDWIEDQPGLRAALKKVELLIVQTNGIECTLTQSAHIVLPATDIAESSGTMTSSDRVVCCRERTANSPGTALPDWQIIAMIGQAMGYSGFEFRKASQVWDEFIPLTVGRPCDMRGLTSARLSREGAERWPCPTLGQSGDERLYADGKFPTPDGLARFIMRPHREPYETPDHDFSVILADGQSIPSGQAPRPMGPRAQRGDQGRTRMFRNATGP